MWHGLKSLQFPRTKTRLASALHILQEALHRTFSLDFTDFEPEPIRDEDLFAELLQRP